MIFGIWSLLWVSYSMTFPALVIPVVALGVRSMLLRKRLTLLSTSALIGTVIIAASHLTVRGNTLETITILGVRIYLSALILLHLWEGVKDATFTRFPLLTFALHYFFRVISIVNVRQKDLWYMFKVRWKFTSWKKRWSLILAAFVNSLVEFIVLIKQVWMVVYARGGVPTSVEWKQVRKRKAIFGIIPFVSALDFLFVVVIIILSVVLPDSFFLSIF